MIVWKGWTVGLFISKNMNVQPLPAIHLLLKPTASLEDKMWTSVASGEAVKVGGGGEPLGRFQTLMSQFLQEVPSLLSLNQVLFWTSCRRTESLRKGTYVREKRVRTCY